MRLVGIARGGVYHTFTERVNDKQAVGIDPYSGFSSIAVDDRDNEVAIDPENGDIYGVNNDTQYLS